MSKGNGIKIIGVVCGVVSALASFAMLATLFIDKDEEPAKPVVQIAAKENINESLRGATGDVKLVIDGNMPLAMGATETQLGGDELESIVIEGAGDGAGITITGDVRTTIKLTNARATLTFKNLTFYDEYAGRITYITDYTHFSGAIAFEDCTFTQGIRLKADANMTFDGCTFVSPSEDRYGVWVEDGRATFADCTFKGYRGLKLHEEEDVPTDDITTVIVSECLFDHLSVKCGVAIGTVNAGTAIKLTNSRFIGCRSWDTTGSLEGLDGVYESDTPVADYTLTLSGNEVSGTVSNIYYIALEDGCILEDFPAGYLTSAHPTEYVQGEGATIAGLENDMSNAFEFESGWYIDAACTIEFDGTIAADQTGDVYLYAIFTSDNWTKNY